MRQALVVLLALALGWGFASAVFAQEREGAWSGTFTDRRGRSLEVAFEVERVSDPHARWRPGSGRVLAVTLVPGGQYAQRFGAMSIPLSDVQLEGETISYRIPVTRDNPFFLVNGSCTLARQEDGSFAGQCSSEDDSPVQVTMTPPAD